MIPRQWEDEAESNGRRAPRSDRQYEFRGRQSTRRNDNCPAIRVRKPSLASLQSALVQHNTGCRLTTYSQRRSLLEQRQKLVQQNDTFNSRDEEKSGPLEKDTRRATWRLSKRHLSELCQTCRGTKSPNNAHLGLPCEHAGSAPVAKLR